MRMEQLNVFSNCPYRSTTVTDVESHRHELFSRLARQVCVFNVCSILIQPSRSSEEDPSGRTRYTRSHVYSVSGGAGWVKEYSGKPY